MLKPRLSGSRISISPNESVGAPQRARRRGALGGSSIAVATVASRSFSTWPPALAASGPAPLGVGVLLWSPFAFGGASIVGRAQAAVLACRLLHQLNFGKLAATDFRMASD
jgi:hypothetical protein